MCCQVVVSFWAGAKPNDHLTRVPTGDEAHTPELTSASPDACLASLLTSTYSNDNDEKVLRCSVHHDIAKLRHWGATGDL